MAALHNVLTPVERGRTQTADGTNYLDTIGRTAVHWGTDLRPAVKWTAGDAVYAPADYTVVATGRGNGTVNSRVPYHSGRFVLLDLGVWGGDRMYVYLGHLAGASVKAGDKGRAGDRIATMGGSGATSDKDFAVHLHLGVAQNTDRPIRPLRNGQGWIDPVAWFAKHGVNLNTTPTAAGLILSSNTTSNTTSTATGTTQKEFTVSQVNDIASATAQAVADISIPVTRSGKLVTRSLSTLVSSIDSQGIHNTGRISELEGIVEKLAEKTGLTAAEVEAAAKVGAELGAEKAISDGVDFGTATITFGKES